MASLSSSSLPPKTASLSSGLGGGGMASSASLASLAAASSPGGVVVPPAPLALPWAPLRYNYIPAHGMRGLDEYRYVAGTYSLLDNLLNPFWVWVANQLPESVAPNLITLVGLLHLFSIGLGVYVFDPHFEGQCPSLLYAWFAWCIWVYGTLDAVDGKQARRTGSSSPLGQLFDHGCDSVGCGFLSVGICSCMSFGATAWTPIMALTIQLPFYLSQYEEHFAHSVRTQVASFGVTEGQYMEAALMLTTALLGKDFWSTQVPFTQELAVWLPGPDSTASLLTLRTVMIYAGCFFPCLLGLSAIGSVAQQGGRKLFAFVHLGPVLALDALLLWTVTGGASNMLQRAFLEHSVPFMLTFSLITSHMANRVIISTVCKMDFPRPDWALFGPLGVIALALGETGKGGGGGGGDEQVEWLVLAAFGLWVVFVYLHYAINVAFQIAKHLKIHILTLGRRTD